MLKIAIAKGAMFNEGLNRLEKIGIHFNEKDINSRSLSFPDTKKTLQLLRVRSWDVPVYVEQGAADLGIVGRDVILEQEKKILSLLDLKFGACKLVIAGPKNTIIKPNLKVATKYPNLTEKYFRKKIIKVNLIKLYGAMELAPPSGLSDIICDLTETGKTLKENNLQIIDTITTSTGYLVANIPSMALYYSNIMKIVSELSNIK